MSLISFRRFFGANYKKTFSSVAGFVYIVMLIFSVEICSNIVAVEKINSVISATLSNQPEIEVITARTPYLYSFQVDLWLQSYEDLKTKVLDVKDLVVGTILLSSSNQTVNLIYLYFIPNSIFSLFNITIPANTTLVSPILANSLEFNGTLNYTFYPVKIDEEIYELDTKDNFTLECKTSPNFEEFFAYLVSFKIKNISKNSIFLPWEILLNKKNVKFRDYFYKIAYFAFLQEKRATVLEKIERFIENRKKHTESVIAIFEKVIGVTGSRTRIYLPVLDNLESFMDNEYRKFQATTFVLLIPVFLALIFYQLQGVELLRICWYKDVLIKKMRGASFFQQFFQIFLLYFVVDVIVFAIMIVGLLFLAIVFRNLLAWINTYLILSFTALLLSSSIQGLGVFHSITDTYKSNIVISEEHNNVVISTPKKFENWTKSKKTKTFVIFLIFLVLEVLITELVGYHFLTIGIDPLSFFILMFFPRISYCIFFVIIVFSYLWKNMLYQVVIFTARIVSKVIKEAIFMKNYLLRTMKKNKFFVFFIAIIVTSFFGIMSYGDTVAHTYEMKRAFMFPYDVMIQLPNTNENKSMLYELSEVEKIAPLYMGILDICYGSMRFLDLIILDAKNFMEYIQDFSVPRLSRMNSKLLNTLATENNTCIISEELSYNVGEQFTFGIYNKDDLLYANPKIIAKTNYLQGIFGLKYNTLNYWIVINYMTLMNETVFKQQANIFFIKLKKNTNTADFIDKLVTKLGISRENIEPQPTLEEKSAEPLFGNFYQNLNLGLDTQLMTLLLYSAYVIFLVAGLFMIIEGNRPQIKLSIEFLYSRGMDRKQAEKGFLVLSWAFFVVLELIGFGMGVVVGSFTAATMLSTETLFFRPYLSIHAVIILLIIISVSLLIIVTEDNKRKLREKTNWLKRRIKSLITNTLRER
ncbi:MAG: hypothetical protein ACTSYD_08430 [Candidatus Heimdallarchaeaceae archaeon]